MGYQIFSEVGRNLAGNIKLLSLKFALVRKWKLNFSSNIDPYDVNFVNKSFHEKITQIEILDCIKRLKNNKALGDNQVIKEYIKPMSDKFIEVHVDEDLF